MEKLLIASYNVQSFFGDEKRTLGPDSSHCARVIREYNPAFVGLNEVRSGEGYELQPQSVGKIAGYPYYYYAPILNIGQSMYGNAVISKYPAKNCEIFPIDMVKNELRKDGVYYEPRCILKAEIEVLGGLTVYISHFGLKDTEHENAVKKLLEIMPENPQKTVLMGDFNMCPDNEILAPIRNILKDSAEGYDEQSLLTWPSGVAERKIDYIFVSKDLKVNKTFVSEKIGSDHKMILTEISL